MRKLSVVLIFLFSVLFVTVPTQAAGSSQLIIINKKTNTLAFYNAGKLVRTFSVATGKTRDLTPEGKFRIVTKIKNRPYYKLGIPGGDPRNPMGNRFMGLEARGTYGDTYGIHGTNNENSIGKYISHGCVRMHNTEVHWLYDRVQLYTPVIITYSSSSFNTIAKANGYNVAPITGWVSTSGKLHYYVNGVMETGWQTISGKRYYFDSSGVMRTGWQTISSKRYYFDSSGVMRTGWQTISSKRYYFDNSGVMKTGWQTISSKRYYFDSSGVMKTGWQTISSKRYYFDNSGVMKTGWQTIAGKRYYFDNTGVMKIGWQTINGKQYYFANDGVMAANTTVDGRKLGPDGAEIQVDYVALGDSLAAGMTPDGIDGPPVNGIDPNWGYPNYIAQDFAKSYQLLNFVNYGVSGYKTDDVITQLGQQAVQNEIKKATHLTIDIGANDLIPLLPVIQKDPAQAPTVIQTVAVKINTILSTIDQLNPKVKVYVMGYYNPYPYVQDPQQKAQLDQLLLAFNGAIQQDAIKNGDTFVATDKAIASDYKDYITNPQNIHLSIAGYQVVAGEFWKVMH